ncbi:pyridine nucleotide-disulfide oxidoreductase [Methyloceanibacter superfactus]|uniref:Sulfide-quinone reductase n=1 Tax=Methyloceanibacter superfactus TaxID=1774969 RepID=A0A1E3W671_9HYPH|nr:FAD-dependent oxidoreductase [Methyloceanibacter superfactus]ODS01291.1 pyridine nucleotide-disulfide oxidoreductase [Methyloceanibacter superfactus]
MAHIVILGGGIGGISCAYELKQALRKEDKVTVVSDKPFFQFTPSNPWVAVKWRAKKDITVDLASTLPRHGVAFSAAGAPRVHPAENRVELGDGSSLNYDYLVIATGPDLAFDEIEGLGPDHHTQSICDVDHATRAKDQWEAFCEDPGPIVIGAVQGASCYGPAYEFAMIADADLRRRRIRDKVPMTFVTAEPYVGHLGVGGVGDTRGLLESEMRQRHIKWVTNAKVDKAAPGALHVTEVDEDGKPKKQHELPFKFSMMLPAFRGIAAVRGIDGLVNPRGFIVVDKHQSNPTFPNIFGVGVCIAIAPLEQTPVPVGVPKTGYMIESMVTATALNIGQRVRGSEPSHEATWNAICLADFGDSGVAFVALPQNPPRNVNWASSGRWVHVAKVAFEKYFLRKVRTGTSEPYFEKAVLKLLDIGKLKRPA